LEIAPAEGRYLSRALGTTQALKLLSTAADLSQVKVTRRNAATSAVETVAKLDLQKMRDNSSKLYEDFALRDGDEIEVPEK
jgi:hypothetical protein